MKLPSLWLLPLALLLSLPLAAAQKATVTPLELPDILPLLGDLYALELSYPEGTDSVKLAVVRGEEGMGLLCMTDMLHSDSVVPSKAAPARLVFGFPAFQDEACNQALSETFYMGLLLSDGSSIHKMCYEEPENVMGYQWALLGADGSDALELTLDTWLPLAVYRPQVPINEGRGGFAAADPSTWLGLFIFFGTEGVTAPEPGINLLRDDERFRTLFEGR